MNVIDIDLDLDPPAVSFFIACTPPTVTAQQKGAMVRGGRVRFFTKKKQADTEHTLWAMVHPHAPSEPLRGPLKCVVTWTFPWRAGDLKSDGQKKRALEGIGWMPCDKQPDADNLVKAFLDVLHRARFYENDAQVACLHVRKGWGDKPGIGVQLCSWDWRAAAEDGL